jgi:hypothetical protein
MATKAGRRSPRDTKLKSSASRPNVSSSARKLTVGGFEFHVFVQINDVYFLDSRPKYARPEGLILPRSSLRGSAPSTTSAEPNHILRPRRLFGPVLPRKANER